MGNVQSSSGESWFFVTNPPVPFEQQLIGEGGGLQPGKVVYLEGEVQPVEEVIKNRFTINFYEYDNIVFHYDVRQWKEENNIVMNSRHENLWQQERRVPMDIKLDQPFRIDVQIMQTGLVITQDHGNPVSFNFRNGVTSEMISKITIEGNIKLATVYYGDAKNMNGSKMQFDVPPTCQSCNQPAWPSNCPPPHCSPSQPPICQNCHQPAWQPNCPPPNCNPNCPPPIQICPGHPTTVTSPSLPLTPPPCQNCHQPAWQPNCPPPNCSPSCPPPCQSCQQPAWQPNCPPPNCFPNQPPTQPPPNSVPNLPLTPPACQNCHQPAWQPNCPPPNCSPSCPPPCQNCRQPAWQPNCPPPNCFPNQPQINVGGICGKPAQPGGCNAPQNAAIPLPNGMCTGRKICITGIPNENAGRFDIDIKGNECDGNRLLHLSVRFLGCDIVMNSMRSFNWECEQRRSGVDFPFQKCQQFQIEIHCDCAGYKIFINGQCYAEFPHRMDCSLAKSVSIDGDLHSINIQEL
uniref:Galectin n=1 Tax=Plectus sambesii TaxID=2011161 RepID=A0A914VZS9_9BILA